MLKLSIFEWVFGVIPENIILIFFMYLFSFAKIHPKRILISVFSMSIIVCLIRLLPIQPGIHTIMIVPIYVIVLKFINKLSVPKAISATILSFIILMVCEGIDVYFLTNVLHLNIEEAFKNLVVKTFSSYISLSLYLIIILIFYFTLYKKKIKNARM